MLTDLDRIRLQAILHGDPDPAGESGSALPQWTTLVHSLLGPVGHIRIDGVDELLWPGTRTALDIWIDGDAEPVDIGGKIGKVHAGFLSKPFLLYGQLNALCGPAVRVVGHSLGAADAEIFAALRLAHGLPVSEIVAFGSPVPGCAPMRDLLAPVVMRNYRNGWEGDLDPIPGVPKPIPLEFPCMQMRDFTMVAGQPDAGDSSLLRCHHAHVYWRGLKALAAQS